MKKWKRVWTNKKYVIKRSLKWMGSFMSFVGFIGLFVPMTDFLENIQNIFFRIIVGMLIVIVIWGLLIVASSIVFINQRRIPVINLANGHHVFVQYGDVFSEDEVLDPSKRRNIVIDCNRCFDTKVNDDLVSSATLHGKTIKRIIDAKKISEEELSNILQKDLKERQKLEATKLTKADKRDGNLERYPAGSIAEYAFSEKEMFFLLGLSQFDYNLTANTKSDEYGEAMMKLIEYIRNRSQGLSIVMPILGTGLAKTGNDQRDTLEFMVKAFKLYRRRLNSDIHIVVWEGDNPISITDL